MKVNWHVIGLILFTKLCIFTLIFLSYQFFPFNFSYYYPNFIYPKNEAITLQTAYKTWDAQHFLYLSEKGYLANDQSNAFSPLYPLSIRLFNVLFSNSFVSGLIVSNGASFVAFYVFYLLVLQWYDEKTAYKSLLFLLCFPTTFFFSLIYSESLFFLCLMLFFFFLTKKNILLASLFAFFMPTIRLIGIGIMLPFMSWFIFDFYHFTVYSQIADIAKKLLNKKTLYVLSPLFGLGTVMLFMYLATGNAFSQFSAQKQYISQYSLLAIVNPISFFHTFFNFPLVLHNFTHSVLDRLFFVGFLVLLVAMFRRLSPSLVVFSIIFGILPVLSGSFMSYMRYLVIIFPLYIVLARLTQEKKYAFLGFSLLYLFTLLQTLFIIMHSLNYWVA